APFKIRRFAQFVAAEGGRSNETGFLPGVGEDGEGHRTAAGTGQGQVRLRARSVQSISDRAGFRFPAGVLGFDLVKAVSAHGVMVDEGGGSRDRQLETIEVEAL